MTRAEVIARSAELRFDNLLRTLGVHPEDREEALARERREAEVFSGRPSEDLRLDPVRRHNWARRLLGR